jgi:uncharacterized protein
MLLVCAALVAGAVVAAANAVRVARGRWLVVAILPAALCFAGVRVAGWWMSSFIVKPNELVREQPYIANNILMTRQAYGLDKFAQREFPAETTVGAADAANNQPTLDNIRLLSGYGIGRRFKIHCARFRKSAPTMTFPISTSIAM